MDKGCSACHNGINIGGGMYAPSGWSKSPEPGFCRRPTKAALWYQDPERRICLQGPHSAQHHADRALFSYRPGLGSAAGGGRHGTSQLGTQLTDDEVDKITAFLGSLTGEQPRVTYPILPPSGAGPPRPEP